MQAPLEPHFEGDEQESFQSALERVKSIYDVRSLYPQASA